MRFEGRTRKKIALKEEQEEILGQRGYLESIMSSMTDSLIVVNPDATIRSVNHAVLDLLGYREDELISRPIKKIFLQEEESILHKYFQKIIDAGEAYNIGLTFLTKQGKAIPVNFSGAVMKQDGKIVGIVGVARDMRQIMAIISDLEEKEIGLEERSKNLTRMQKAMLHMMDDLEIAKKEAEKAEQAIKDTAYQFQAVVEFVGDGITFSDSSGKFLVYNLKMQELTGYTVDEANNSGDFTRLLYPQPLERQKALQRLHEIAEHKAALPLEAETTIQAKDGTKKVLWVSTVEMRFKGQQMFLSIYRDITERKKVEEREIEFVAAKTKIDIERAKAAELKKAYDELKEAQERLLRSEKLAALGKLAGSVSHELRNPLGVIRNSVYFLKMKLGRELEDKKIKKHLDILEKEIETSDRIINDILAFARIKETRLAETDINYIIKDLLKVIKIPKNIKITSQLNSNLPHISADEVQLKQAFSNIMLNAVQAMPDGGELTIANRTNNENIGIDIIDTGTGISKEDLDKMFNPLFSTKAQGTGLGLTVCQGIIEIHGGSIEVESEIGKGTKFIVKLPINKSQNGS